MYLNVNTRNSAASFFFYSASFFTLIHVISRPLLLDCRVGKEPLLQIGPNWATSRQSLTPPKKQLIYISVMFDVSDNFQLFLKLMRMRSHPSLKNMWLEISAVLDVSDIFYNFSEGNLEEPREERTPAPNPPPPLHHPQMAKCGFQCSFCYSKNAVNRCREIITFINFFIKGKYVWKRMDLTWPFQLLSVFIRFT